MFFTAIVTAVLSLLTYQNTVAADAEFDPSLLCPIIANGTKIKDPRYCNVYIECVDEEPLSITCDNGLFFDLDSQSCVYPTAVKCLSSDPCAILQGKDGFVPDPYSCTSYYYCRSGKGSIGECSSGLNYNPESNNCVRNYPCQITLIPDDYCNIVPPGVFIKDPSSCMSYQICWQSQLYNGTCPSGFYFNPVVGDCDYPENVDCSQPTTPIPEIPENVKCKDGDVFISDETTCDGYYYCKPLADNEYELVPGTCPTGRFFDPADTGACVLRTNIACPYNRCITLGTNNIQLANIYDDDCTGFAICQDGEMIAESECPSGYYFDEVTQRCTDELISYPACKTLYVDTTAVTEITVETTNTAASITNTTEEIQIIQQ